MKLRKADLHKRVLTLQERKFSYHPERMGGILHDIRILSDLFLRSKRQAVVNNISILRELVTHEVLSAVIKKVPVHILANRQCIFPRYSICS